MTRPSAIEILACKRSRPCREHPISYTLKGLVCCTQALGPMFVNDFKGLQELKGQRFSGQFTTNGTQGTVDCLDCFTYWHRPIWRLDTTKSGSWQSTWPPTQQNKSDTYIYAAYTYQKSHAEHGQWIIQQIFKSQKSRKLTAFFFASTSSIKKSLGKVSQTQVPPKDCILRDKTSPAKMSEIQSICCNSSHHGLFESAWWLPLPSSVVKYVRRYFSLQRSWEWIQAESACFWLWHVFS